MYVRPFHASAARWQVSTRGGLRPRWRRDAREITYLNDRCLMAVSFLAAESAPRLGMAQRLFCTDADSYEANVDGQRFLVRLLSLAAAIHVVIGWTEELRR